MADPIVIDCADRAEWLRRRARGIGGSDVPRILGSSPYGGPWSVWADRRQARPPDTGDHLQAGLDDEPHLLTHLRGLGALAADERIEHRPWRLVRRRDEPWATCSPDAVVTDDWGWLAGVELKHHDRPDWTAWAPSWTPVDLERPPCPLHIVHQAMWCAYVCGVRSWSIVAALGGRERRWPDVRVYRVDVTPAVLSPMVERVRRWHERHILGGVEPLPTSADEALAAAAWHHPVPTTHDTRDATPSDEADMARHVELGALIERATEERDTIGARLRERIGEARTLRGARYRATWSAPGTTTRLAGRERIEEVAPDLYRLLREAGLVTEATTARRFTVAPVRTRDAAGD